MSMSFETTPRDVHLKCSMIGCVYYSPYLVEILKYIAHLEDSYIVLAIGIEE